MATPTYSWMHGREWFNSSTRNELHNLLTRMDEFYSLKDVLKKTGWEGICEFTTPSNVWMYDSVPKIKACLQLEPAHGSYIGYLYGHRLSSDEPMLRVSLEDDCNTMNRYFKYVSRLQLRKVLQIICHETDIRVAFKKIEDALETDNYGDNSLDTIPVS